MSKKIRKKQRIQILNEISVHSHEVSYKQVIEAVHKVFPKTIQLQFLDGEFTALPFETWEKIIYFTSVDKAKYLTSKRDCDNFAIAFSGQCSLKFGINGVGIVVDISGKHAYNCILVKDNVDRELYVKIVEPQTDGFVKLGDNLSRQEAYVADKGWILFA